MRLLHRLPAPLALITVAFTLTACNGSPVSSPIAGAALQGKVFGGQQPITGATIQLWSVGTTADGGPSTALLTTAVTTSDGSGAANSNANPGNGNNTLGPGYFNITGDYTCPAGDALVYLTASGGNPGLADGTNNTGIQNMAALGSCNNLQTNVQFLTVNELTTVGAVTALFPYMSGYNAIGATPAHAAALTSAFNTANEYVNFQNGQAPGPALPAGLYASTVEANTLADVIAACVNTSGGAPTDGTVCGNLYDLTKPASAPAPTDTVAALIDLFKNPTANVAAIFNLQSNIVPFQPARSTPPIDWTLPIMAQPGTPAFSVPSGTYTAVQTLAITDSDATALIYYTTDGSTPSTSSPVYTSAFTVSATQTIKALAVEAGRMYSPVASAAFVITIPPTAAPTFSVAAGSYTSAQTVSLASTTPGAAIYFTTNGATPTTASTLYTSAVSVGTPETLTAIAIGPGCTASAAISAAYTITPVSGMLSTLAGNGTLSFSGDGGPATSAQLYSPRKLTSDSAGNLYFVDVVNQRVRKIDAYGKISTVAGNGTAASTGDGGLATSASLSTPAAVAVDSAGNLYIAEAARVRMVNTSGIISTFAGTGTAGYNGDGIQAATAQLNSPLGLAFDSTGNLYICDLLNQRIRKIDSTGVITTVAGTGTSGFSGDGAAATVATLHNPNSIAFDPTGNLFIGDNGNWRIRKVNTSGNISTVAGSGTAGDTGDGGLALSASIYGSQQITFDVSGNMFFTESSGERIRKIDTAGYISTFAGNGASGFSGDGGPAASAQLNDPTGVTSDSHGNLFIADTSSNRIRRVDTSGNISTFAGTGVQRFGGDGTAGPNAELYSPHGVAVDAAGNLYIADTGNNRIRRINAATGYISTFAGNGSAAFAGDGGPATSASLNAPWGLAFDSTGNLYIADSANNRIRMIDPSGNITTAAGNGTATFAGDGGQPTAASLKAPFGVAVDSTGVLYIADSGNSRIRMVSGGTISTFAGNGTAGFAGDGASATAAQLKTPYSVAAGAGGNVYISDTGNNRIRLVTGGIITTVAGSNSTAGYAGDGASATAARLYTPAGITVDSSGNLYIADSGNQRIRKVSGGNITTVAGSNLTAGYAGDGASATAATARLSTPYGIAVDPSANLYIADTGNNHIRGVAH